LFIINLIGYGIGPPFIGFMADFFTNSHLATSVVSETLNSKCNFADASLSQPLRDACLQAKTYGMKTACLIIVVFYVLAAVVFSMSGRFLKKDTV